MKLPEDKLVELREVFCMFDKKGKGYITPEDLKTIMSSLGQNPTARELLDFFSCQDENGGVVEMSFSKFLEIMDCADSEEEANREAFNLFDRHRTGFISTADLTRVMTSFGEKLTDEEITELIREVDKDGDGLVSYQEFLDIIMW